MAARYPLVPLEVSPETVGGTLLSLGATTMVWTAVYHLYGRRQRGAADATAALTRCRRAVRWGLPVAYVTTLLAMTAGGWLDVVDGLAAAVPDGETPVGDALSLVVGLSGPLVAVLGAYLGLFPAMRSLRGVNVAATTALARLARWVVGLVGLVVALLVVAGALGANAATGVGFLGLVVALALVLVVGSPWVIRILQSTRVPTDAERERVECLAADVGLDPAGVRVLETGGAEQAYAILRGVPGWRHLFVTDFLLAELDDERLRAYLALQAGRARTFHLETKVTVVAGSLGLAGTLVLGLVSVPGVTDGVAALGSLAAGGVGLWVGERLVYRADRYAVERTSRAAVEGAIESFAELNDVPMQWGRLAAIRRMDPPLARRIDRLRDRTANE